MNGIKELSSDHKRHDRFPCLVEKGHHSTMFGGLQTSPHGSVVLGPNIFLSNIPSIIENESVFRSELLLGLSRL